MHVFVSYRGLNNSAMSSNASFGRRRPVVSCEVLRFVSEGWQHEGLCKLVKLFNIISIRDIIMGCSSS